jgi:hypothetical protein
MVAGNVYADDPLDDSGTKGSRKEMFKHFKKHYAEFWDTLLRDSSETEALFVFGDENAEVDAENAERGASRKNKRGDSKKTDPGGANASSTSRGASSLFDAVSDAVALFSGSRARTVRVAATRAGLQLVSSLVAIAKAKAETRDTKQRQLDAESRKKRPNAAMTRALAEALSETQTRIRGAERMIADAFTKIFTHRFRDVDANVRAQCMQSIGEWMRSHPLFFLSDVYLKYLGWSLSDKDPRVRRAVLAALRALYAASAENLALMDTFNARFQPRIAEMIHDVDASVAVEAVGTLAALHAAGVVPHEEMQQVAALLLDADARVRGAAARVVPALLAGDAARAKASAETSEEDEGIATSRGLKKSSKTNDDKDAKTRETLMSLVALVRRLGGSRARAAGAVDALWEEFGDSMSEWGVALDAFLREERGERKTGSSKTKKSRVEKDAAASVPSVEKDAGPVGPAGGDSMDAESAAGLANLLACAARRARGERLVQPEGAPRPYTKAQRESHERAREAFTQSAMRSLPAALRKWRSDEAVVAPLLETARHLRLEHYSLRHKEKEFDELAAVVSDIFRAHSGRRTLDACAAALHHFSTEGSESIREMAKRRVDSTYAETAEKLRAASAEVAEAGKKKNAKKGSSSSSQRLARSLSAAAEEEDGAQFKARVELTRLNALLSLMPPPSGPNTSVAARDLFDDLVTVVADAAEARAALQPRAVALATRAASLWLSHALFDLVDRGASGVTAAEVKEHVALRDAFVRGAVALARTSMDAMDAEAEEAAARGDAAGPAAPPGPAELGRRAVPKAAVAAFAHLVVMYQRPRAAAAEAAEAEAKRARDEAPNAGAEDNDTKPEVDPAACEPAPVFQTLELAPDEDAFRAAWDACNQLLDPPSASNGDGADDGDDDFGDEETARLAYALATAEAAVGEHRFVAAELLANRDQSGAWTDHAIAALLADLRRLGPKAVGDVIFYSLVSAFDEVTGGDRSDPDVVVAMEHAFEEFSARLAHMFNVGSARDRVVCRHVVEEGLKYCIPTSAPDPEKQPFLSLGLAAFVPKLAAADARAFVDPLNMVLSAVDAEHADNAPLADFAERVVARAAGATGRDLANDALKRRDAFPPRDPKEEETAKEETAVHEEPTQDEEPVRALGGGRRR